MFTPKCWYMFGQWFGMFPNNPKPQQVESDTEYWRIIREYLEETTDEQGLI